MIENNTRSVFKPGPFNIGRYVTSPTLANDGSRPNVNMLSYTFGTDLVLGNDNSFKFTFFFNPYTMADEIRSRYIVALRRKGDEEPRFWVTYSTIGDIAVCSYSKHCRTKKETFVGKPRKLFVPGQNEWSFVSVVIYKKDDKFQAYLYGHELGLIYYCQVDDPSGVNQLDIGKFYSVYSLASLTFDPGWMNFDEQKNCGSKLLLHHLWEYTYGFANGFTKDLIYFGDYKGSFPELRRHYFNHKTLKYQPQPIIFPVIGIDQYFSIFKKKSNEKYSFHKLHWPLDCYSLALEQYFTGRRHRKIRNRENLDSCPAGIGVISMELHRYAWKTDISCDRAFPGPFNKRGTSMSVFPRSTKDGPSFAVRYK